MRLDRFWFKENGVPGELGWLKVSISRLRRILYRAITF